MVLRLQRSAGLGQCVCTGGPRAETWTRPSDGPNLFHVSLATWRVPAQGNRAIGSWVQIPYWLGDLEPVDTSLGLSLVTCEMGGKTALYGCLRTALSYQEALKAAYGHPINSGLGGGVGPQP